MTPTPYHPSAAEAREHLRRWSTRHAALRRVQEIEAPGDWLATAVDVVLEELERYEQANEGMIVTDLAAYHEQTPDEAA